jgi:hypothetical protein
MDRVRSLACVLSEVAASRCSDDLETAASARFLTEDGSLRELRRGPDAAGWLSVTKAQGVVATCSSGRFPLWITVSPSLLSTQIIKTSCLPPDHIFIRYQFTYSLLLLRWLYYFKRTAARSVKLNNLQYLDPNIQRVPIFYYISWFLFINSSWQLFWQDGRHGT